MQMKPATLDTKIFHDALHLSSKMVMSDAERHKVPITKMYRGRCVIFLADMDMKFTDSTASIAFQPSAGHKLLLAEKYDVPSFHCQLRGLQSAQMEPILNRSVIFIVHLDIKLREQRM